jgi:hypothetical protein
MLPSPLVMNKEMSNDNRKCSIFEGGNENVECEAGVGTIFAKWLSYY